MIATLDGKIEPFVAAEVAATFLCITRRRVLEMARAGEIPAHPIGQGNRKQWRFRLSELADAMFVESPVPKTTSKVSSTQAVPCSRIGGIK